VQLVWLCSHHVWQQRLDAGLLCGRLLNNTRWAPVGRCLYGGCLWLVRLNLELIGGRCMVPGSANTAARHVMWPSHVVCGMCMTHRRHNTHEYCHAVLLDKDCRERGSCNGCCKYHIGLPAWAHSQQQLLCCLNAVFASNNNKKVPSSITYPSAAVCYSVHWCSRVHLGQVPLPQELFCDSCRHQLHGPVRPGVWGPRPSQSGLLARSPVSQPGILGTNSHRCL